ncbi:MAG: capsule assembly Wzi family protein [Dysgonamonadaceae bacterium]|jgi:hypothetical protein|nr:capsule assembly Wzi family protein [Dysgonamonadaceae bacterium]
MKRLIITGLIISLGLSSQAQMQTSYKAETFGSAATGEHTPFWMVNHNWGTVSAEANNFYLRGGVFHEQKLNKDWSFDAGIDVIAGNKANYGKAWIQQLYGRINWKIFRLDAGMRENYTALFDPYLSSGDMTQSNNARPLPQIWAGIPEFWLVPYTRGQFFVKGEVSVGKYLDGQWQENTARPYYRSYVQNVLSHHKSIYFRFGDMKNRHKQQFTVGMTQDAQWGGDFYTTTYSLNADGEWQKQYDYFAKKHGLREFIAICLAQGGEGGVSAMDRSFISGSHWGSYILKYDYKWSENIFLSAYLQHFFEDGTGMGWFNYPDNLYGLSFHSKEKTWLSGAVAEVLYTKHQSGPIHIATDLDAEHYDDYFFYSTGNDNYYNNEEYRQGPSHFGKSMGTPLLLSPEYNNDGSLNFQNNRVIAFHLGAEGYLYPSLQYRLLLTHGQGWGRFYHPFTSVKKGFASQLEVIYTCQKFEGLSAKLSIGCDTGEFFGGKTFGGGISIRKEGRLF